MSRQWIEMIWRRLAFGFAVCLAVTAPEAILAQIASVELPVGTRIRLRAPDVGVPWTATAIIDSLSPDTMYVRRLSDPRSLRHLRRFAVPLSSVARLDVSLGHKSRFSRAGAGALWGLAIYGLIGGGMLLHEYSTCGMVDCSDDGMAVVSLIVGAPWAAAIGGTIGFSLPVEKWRRLPVPKR